MAYDVTLVAFDTTSGSNPFGHNTGLMGFPSTFHTVIYSQWMCEPVNPITGWTVGIGPGFVEFIGINYLTGEITLTRNFVTGSLTVYDGTFTPAAPGVRTHAIVSVDTVAQVVQLYLNDAPVTVTGTWSDTFFHLPPSAAMIWTWFGEGTLTSGLQPGCGDIWCAQAPGDTLFDLSIVGNRRKFINADLSPVYLGANGELPLGSPPNIYCTVPTGGVPSDFLINRGIGDSFTLGDSVISFQPPGTCTLPGGSPPPPPSSLALDNVVAYTAADAAGELIFLDWSDNRGRSYRDPVSQPIGARGKYLTSVMWQRLGYARDRVFRLTWSVPVKTALQGAFIEADTRAKS